MRRVGAGDDQFIGCMPFNAMHARQGLPIQFGKPQPSCDDAFSTPTYLDLVCERQDFKATLG